MNPIQLRETTMSADTRRLVQLVAPNVTLEESDVSDSDFTIEFEGDEMEVLQNPIAIFDRLLARNQRQERKEWIESKHFVQEI